VTIAVQFFDTRYSELNIKLNKLPDLYEILRIFRKHDKNGRKFLYV
jgi:hypothetical protein